MSSVGMTGGDKLKAYLEGIAKKAARAESVKVGFLENSTYPNGISVPFVAFMNEYGHVVHGKEGGYFVMPRPFFRNMIAQCSPQWGKQLGNLAVKNKYDMFVTFSLMGEGIRAQLQESIRTFNSVPLAESTIARKGFDKQLIDTSHMINSVDYEVN